MPDGSKYTKIWCASCARKHSDAARKVYRGGTIAAIGETAMIATPAQHHHWISCGMTGWVGHTNDSEVTFSRQDDHPARDLQRREVQCAEPKVRAARQRNRDLVRTAWTLPLHLIWTTNWHWCPDERSEIVGIVC